ncbi:bacillithiol system redox-active protein YtxJ [Psychroflexus tropicus]|uniref:bacillithiol system redox-active protein YtxJ n=1 Tax=Psychroflexus tropicus TaxID=197345 RepID=UPI0003789F32|nr:bacillithiol system redox-active protein YtxJ [Psychroflexus tropicus]
MGLFSKLFNTQPSLDENDSAQFAVTWKKLENTSQLDAVEELSKEKFVAIFKHSVTCGISHMVWHQFQNEIDFNNDHIEMLYLDLLAHRDVSNEIARRFQVLHQSPQLIIIKDGEVVHHASHSAIRISNIRKLLEEH